MQQSNTLTDNQQERLSYENEEACLLAYLAGFFDADGCFSLYMALRRNRMYLVAHTQCTNCDFAQIDSITEMLNTLAIPFNITNRKPAKINHRSSKDIIISGTKRNLLFLPRIIPYLRGKQDRAMLLLAYCEARNAKSTHDSYNEFELSIYQIMRKENKRGA